jgi:hypothetical protein
VQEPFYVRLLQLEGRSFEREDIPSTVPQEYRLFQFRVLQFCHPKAEGVNGARGHVERVPADQFIHPGVKFLWANEGNLQGLPFHYSQAEGYGSIVLYNPEGLRE